MKKKFLFALLVCSLSLSACSSKISEEQYNTLLEENKKLEEENKKLKDSIQEQNDQNLEQIVPESWAQVSFGEDGVFLIEDSAYMLCIDSGTYEATAEDLARIWQKFLTASSTLASFKSEIGYNKISVKYLATDGTTLIEFTLKNNGDNYILDGITGDLTKSNILVPLLEVISSK